MTDPTRLVLGAMMTAAGIVIAEVLTGNSEPDEIKQRVRQLAGQDNGRKL